MKFAQILGPAAEKLFEYSGTIPIIDTHEHIPVKEEYYNGTTMKFGNLFNPYIANDLASSGMSFPRDQWAAMVCIPDDWDTFEPHWQQVKFGSYARPLRIALERYYGAHDLNRENYQELLGNINRNNTPGIYQRVLGRDCNIETAITCSDALPQADDLILKGNINSPSFMCRHPDQVRQLAEVTGSGLITSLDEFLVVVRQWTILQKQRGAAAFKSRAFLPGPLDRTEASRLFRKLISGQPLEEPECYPLAAVVREETAAAAAELDLPVALHTGVWGDFRQNSVLDVIHLAERNPDTRFDVYHIGIPEVRAAALIAKNFQNCSFNMCWSHTVAPEMTVRTLDEAFDLVPMNKIFAFGGDYVYFIEQVYGHLWMARENVSRVLGSRVDRGLLDLDEAQHIMKSWFYDNPKKFYRFPDVRSH